MHICSPRSRACVAASFIINNAVHCSGLRELYPKICSSRSPASFTLWTCDFCIFSANFTSHQEESSNIRKQNPATTKMSLSTYTNTVHNTIVSQEMKKKSSVAWSLQAILVTSSFVLFCNFWEQLSQLKWM